MIDRFSWVAIYPEIVLLVMGCVIALIDLLDNSKRRISAYVLSLLTLLGVLDGGLSLPPLTPRSGGAVPRKKPS